MSFSQLITSRLISNPPSSKMFRRASYYCYLCLKTKVVHWFYLMDMLLNVPRRFYPISLSGRIFFADVNKKTNKQKTLHFSACGRLNKLSKDELLSVFYKLCICSSAMYSGMFVELCRICSTFTRVCRRLFDASFFSAFDACARSISSCFTVVIL